jgi:hypothetical protein
MTSTTHTTAGLLAHAGAARLDVAAAPAALGGHSAAQSAYGHQSAIWTMGVIAKPATFVVFDRTNHPITRPLSEHSP